MGPGQSCAIVGEGNIRQCVGCKQTLLFLFIYTKSKSYQKPYNCLPLFSSVAPGDGEACSDYDPRDDGVFREDDERFDDDDEEEEEGDRERRASNEGMEDRHLASFLSESVDECQRGLTCNMDTRRCETANG